MNILSLVILLIASGLIAALIAWALVAISNRPRKVAPVLSTNELLDAHLRRLDKKLHRRGFYKNSRR